MNQVVATGSFHFLQRPWSIRLGHDFCNIACPAVAFKVLNALNIAKLLNEMHVLIKHKRTHAIFIRHYL